MLHLNQRPSLHVLPAVALAGALLAGCGSDSTDAAADPPPDETGLAVADAWVRSSDGPMTAAFGTITNTSSDDVTVVSAETDASDRTELHEVVMIDGSPAMQPKADGFVVPAGGEHLLEPGADHIMVMDMDEEILPGDDVEITLLLDDGTAFTYSAQARESEVGDEDYVPAEGHEGMHGDG